MIEQSDIKLIIGLGKGHTMVSYVDEVDRWWVCSCGSISQGDLAFDVTSDE